MFLILDNSQENKINLSLQVNKKFVQRNYAVARNRDFLHSVNLFLSGLKLKPSNLTGLGMVMGQGKFTATRLLVTMANTLAYSLKIPILRLTDSPKGESIVDMPTESEIGQYILPVYASEPHVQLKPRIK